MTDHRDAPEPRHVSPPRPAQEPPKQVICYVAIKEKGVIIPILDGDHTQHPVEGTQMKVEFRAAEGRNKAGAIVRYHDSLDGARFESVPYVAWRPIPFAPSGKSDAPLKFRAFTDEAEARQALTE